MATQDLKWRTVVIAVAVLLGAFLTAGFWSNWSFNRGPTVIHDTFKFSTKVPPLMSNQSLFCAFLGQNKGLQNLVSSVSEPAEAGDAGDIKLVTLSFVVGASPNEATYTPMVSLYKQVLNGHPDSTIATTDIAAVVGMNSCAR